MHMLWGGWIMSIYIFFLFAHMYFQIFASVNILLKVRKKNGIEVHSMSVTARPSVQSCLLCVGSLLAVGYCSRKFSAHGSASVMER